MGLNLAALGAGAGAAADEMDRQGAAQRQQQLVDQGQQKVNLEKAQDARAATAAGFATRLAQRGEATYAGEQAAAAARAAGFAALRARSNPAGYDAPAATSPTGIRNAVGSAATGIDNRAVLAT